MKCHLQSEVATFSQKKTRGTPKSRTRAGDSVRRSSIAALLRMSKHHYTQVGAPTGFEPVRHLERTAWVYVVALLVGRRSCSRPANRCRAVLDAAGRFRLDVVQMWWSSAKVFQACPATSPLIVGKCRPTRPVRPKQQVGAGFRWSHLPTHSRPVPSR